MSAHQVMILFIPAFVFSALASFGLWISNRKSEKKIRLDSPCPGCGHRGCKIAYNPQLKRISRTCNTCGCVVTQPPVAPHLFESQK